MIQRKQVVFLISAIAFLAILSTSASAGGGTPQLVGSWEVLSAVDGSTGENASLHTYGTGGTYIASAASTSNGNAHGAWNQTGPQTYSSTEISFLFAPTGELIGTFHVDAALTVAADGQSYDADFEGEVRITGGPVFPFSGTAVATRIGDSDSDSDSDSD